jgi:transcriptional regulator with XRE-family HTH domain
VEDTGLMVAAESPAVAKHIVQRFLRRAREAKSLTQGQVARQLRWSLSKVQRIENGDTGVSPSDLEALLGHYGPPATDELEGLLALLTIARRRDNWWDKPEYRSHLTPATRELLQFEGEATTLFVYNPFVLPGLLQNKEYAEAVLRFYAAEVNEDQAAVRLRARLRRRTDFMSRLTGDKPPGYRVLLDESVLHRLVCPPEVMREQLKELLRLIVTRVVELRVLRLASPNPASHGPFVLMDFVAADPILYQETEVEDQIDRTREQVGLFRNRFDRMWRTAADSDATELVIRRKIDEFS